MSRPPTIETGAEPRRSKVAQSPVELKEVIAAERTGHPFLVWRTDEGEQRILLLDQQRWRVTIGRDPAADIPLPWDAEVSRTHALLEQVGRGWTVVDDGLSRNGSFVNGARAIGRRRLRDKDRMVFGATEVTYRETSGAITQTASAIDAPAAIPLSPMQRKVLIALCRPVHESGLGHPGHQPPDRRGRVPDRRRGQGPPPRAVRALRPESAAPEREARATRGGRARLRRPRPARLLNAGAPRAPGEV